MEGFRAAFRWPSLTFSEIAWRWSVGVTATLLFFFGLFEYLSTLPVTSGEILFLRTRQPFLVAQALAHIFRGSLRRAVLSIVVGALLIALLWAVAASLGRIANVRFLVTYFRERVAESSLQEAVPRGIVARPAFGELLRINFLRALAAFGAILGFFGATIVPSFFSPQQNPRPALAFFVFICLVALIALIWWELNWLLSLAGMFAVRDGANSLGAIPSAVALVRERTGPVMAVSTWTGLAHLVLFSAASSVGAVPLAFAGLLPGRLIALAMLLITLAYFAIADWLYMARMAGYVCIAEAPFAMLYPQAPAPFIQPAPVQTTIDREELILSDVPGLSPQT